VGRAAAIPVLEFRIADLNAEYRGASMASLMDNAGKAVAREVRRRVKGAHPRAVVFCGQGNNGGDGYVAARELAGHFHVTVVFAEGREAVDAAGISGGALKHLEADRSVRKIDWSPSRRTAVERACRGAAVVLDGLLGSGISGPARAPYPELIALINRVGALKVAIDVPSGFPFAPAVRPDLTVTIEAPKVGMTRANSGRIVPVRIGFPPEAWTHTGPGDLLLVPRVDDFAEKADRGILAVVAGGPYSGAPALVALAAHAAGIGLVHVFTPERVADVVRRFDPTLVVHGLPGGEVEASHVEGLLAEISKRRCAALAVGPGLGRARGTQDAVRLLLQGLRVPAVVDADAIAAATLVPEGTLSRAILTPHAREFRLLSKQPAGDSRDVKTRKAAARAAAAAHRTALLLKGHVSVITDGRRMKLNDAGVSAMAVGGAGDVLTGLIGAMLAKGLSPFDAGRVGAFVSGRAGEIAFETLGHSLKPTDMIDAVPRVFAGHLPWWGGKP